MEQEQSKRKHKYLRLRVRRRRRSAGKVRTSPLTVSSPGNVGGSQLQGTRGTPPIGGRRLTWTALDQSRGVTIPCKPLPIKGLGHCTTTGTTKVA